MITVRAREREQNVVSEVAIGGGRNGSGRLDLRVEDAGGGSIGSVRKKQSECGAVFRKERSLAGQTGARALIS